MIGTGVVGSRSKVWWSLSEILGLETLTRSTVGIWVNMTDGVGEEGGL